MEKFTPNHGDLIVEIKHLLYSKYFHVFNFGNSINSLCFFHCFVPSSHSVRFTLDSLWLCNNSFCHLTFRGNSHCHIKKKDEDMHIQHSTFSVQFQLPSSQRFWVKYFKWNSKTFLSHNFSFLSFLSELVYDHFSSSRAAVSQCDSCRVTLA